MEPPVRYYNSNAPSGPRKRTGRSGSGRKSTASQAPTASAEVSEQPLDTRVSAEPEPQAEAQDLTGQVVDVSDFEEIFTRFQTPLCNFVFRLVGNREQALDLTQDVFVKAYRALAGGTTIQAGALSSWLYRIASNTATDALRRRRLIAWLPLSLFNEDRGVGAGLPGGMEAPGSQPGSGDDSILGTSSVYAGGGYDGARFEQRVADREIVQRVLDRLPPKYAACLLLYEHEGFSCAEIAEVLNVSPSAVKMRLMRARERFITLYKQEVAGD
jgi:RNA polymerase sigma-70 factor, ECF subfamily